MSRAKRWCYTINNPSEEVLLEDDCIYHVFGREVGEFGTPHLQGFIIFKQSKRLTQLQRLLPGGHYEVTRGSMQQASDYCKKDGDFVEYGELPEEPHVAGGRATMARWNKTRELAKEGKIEEIDSDIYIRYRHSLLSIAKEHAPMPDDHDDTTGYWFYGAPGTGKSRTARDENPGYYLKLCNKWWDGYKGEEVVIIDDFDTTHACLAHHLKIWSDRYAFPAEIKGGKINIRPKKIIVTSNYEPSEIWKDDVTIAAIHRRFSIKKFT